MSKGLGCLRVIKGQIWLVSVETDSAYIQLKVQGYFFLVSNKSKEMLESESCVLKPAKLYEHNSKICIAF